jgi:hypothetical protein
MASETQIYAIGTCAIGILANRPNAQESDRPLNKPPILPNLPTIYNLFMQNKANFKCKAPLHKQCDLLHLEGSFVMGHLSRYWQAKPKVSDRLYRKAIK